METMPLIFAASGAVFGAFADRLSARWPSHADGASRSVDWRTVAVLASGLLVFAALVVRWPEPRDQLVLGVYFAALIVLLATDLDQKLLPDLLTLPLIAFALIVLLLGWNPMLAGKELGVFSGIAAGIAAPLVLVLTSRLFGGGIGMGDVKLAVSLGLMFGISHLIQGFLLASIGSSVVIVLLIATRRIGRRTPIPFGPILIAAGIVAGLLA
jgi:prepilin signal peptidase PulO-like enzyme (type II secretory pathway)